MIYAIDFDGTIVENAFPAIGELKPAAERFIREIHRKGDKWILYTMREVPFINHFNTIQSGCPFKDSQCHTVKHIEIIQKVRDGE